MRAQRGMSRAMTEANSSGVLPTGRRPMEARRPLSSGVATMRRTSAESRSTMGRGVPAATKVANQPLASKPARPS